ncbi:MAG: ABC transporter ATP-binding protein [Clostridia bacterium]|nr:ABC transporter ATP-binding protein [Clostridia bacterium]
MYAIKTVALTKKYKDLTAVNALDLTVKDGEFFSLLGVNGAGKTTTVKMLSTLTRPTSGDAFVYDRSIITEPDEVKKLIDISMQETAIARNLTAAENIAFYCELNGLKKDETQKMKEYLYDKFGLNAVADKKAAKLSGGWQRKLSIALALISEPKLLFLDEPTLGLDVIARRELWGLLRALKGKITVVLTTHYMEEAEALSDKIGVMCDGRLLFCGTKEQMYERTGKSDVENAFISIVETYKTKGGL